MLAGILFVSLGWRIGFLHAALAGGNWYVDQSDLELGMIFISLPLEIWDYRYNALGLVLPQVLTGTTYQSWLL